MVDYHRADWQTDAEPVTGLAPNWPKVTTPVAHHSGASVIPNDIAQWLRNMQHDYLTNRQPPYSLGYGWLCTQNGDSWEIRGNTYRNAANSGRDDNVNDNEWTVSYLFGTTPHEPASDAAIATANRLWHARCVPLMVERPSAWLGHLDLDGTACPGSGNVQRLIAGDFDRIVWRPTPPDDRPPMTGDGMITQTCYHTTLDGQFALVSGRWSVWFGTVPKGEGVTDLGRVGHLPLAYAILGDCSPGAEREYWQARHDENTAH